jgi:DNA polymerase-3 subunit alpha (Gram-positive type)
MIEDDRIIEIGAVRIKDGQILDKFCKMIDPGISIPDNIIKLTGINDDMVMGKQKIHEVIPELAEFIGSAALVAHNAKFDMGFIKKAAGECNISLKNPVIDTLNLSKLLFPKLNKFKLDVVAKHLDIKLDNHHRAVDDAEATAQIFLRFVEMLKKRGANDLKDIDKLYIGNFDIKKADTYHSIILVKNHEGLYNLYKLISMSP